VRRLPAPSDQHESVSPSRDLLPLPPSPLPNALFPLILHLTYNPLPLYFLPFKLLPFPRPLPLFSYFPSTPFTYFLFLSSRIYFSPYSLTPYPPSLPHVFHSFRFNDSSPLHSITTVIYSPTHKPVLIPPTSVQLRPPVSLSPSSPPSSPIRPLTHSVHIQLPFPLLPPTLHVNYPPLLYHLHHPLRLSYIIPF